MTQTDLLVLFSVICYPCALSFFDNVNHQAEYLGVISTSHILYLSHQQIPHISWIVPLVNTPTLVQAVNQPPPVLQWPPNCSLLPSVSPSCSSWRDPAEV